MPKLNRQNALTQDDLRKIRIQLGVTIPEAAKRIGVDRATWWRWEETGAPIPQKQIKPLLALLEEEGIDVGQVLPFAGLAKAEPVLDSTTVQVPVYNIAASAGSGNDLGEEYIAGRIGLDIAYVKAVFQCPPLSIFAVAVDGDSMEPGIRSGEVALVARAPEGAPIRDGIHLLRLEGALLCKRLGRLPGRRLAVASDNPSYPSFEIDLEDDRLDLSVLGRVVGVLRRT